MGVPNAFAKVSGVTPAVISATGTAFVDSYASAFRTYFYSTIPFSVLALVVAFWVKDASHLLNNQVAVKQEKERFRGGGGGVREVDVKRVDYEEEAY